MKNYILGLVLLTLFSCTNNNTSNTGTAADSLAADSTEKKSVVSSGTEL
jgi:hypothetical protein